MQILFKVYTSLSDVLALLLNTFGHAFGHAAHQFLFSRVLKNCFLRQLAKVFKGAVVGLQLSEFFFRTWPNVFSRVQVWAMRWPTRQKLHIEFPHSSSGGRCPKYLLPIQQDLDVVPATRKASLKEGAKCFFKLFRPPGIVEFPRHQKATHLSSGGG